MIFQHTLDHVLSGRKTQTRRLWPAGYRLVADPVTDRLTVRDQRGHVRYCVGQERAVQPGRGKKGVARINITELRVERLHKITWLDAISEGVKDPHRADLRMDERNGCVAQYQQIWASIHRAPETQWNKNPEVLVITFTMT